MFEAEWCKTSLVTTAGIGDEVEDGTLWIRVIIRGAGIRCMF